MADFIELFVADESTVLEYEDPVEEVPSLRMPSLGMINLAALYGVLTDNDDYARLVTSFRRACEPEEIGLLFLRVPSQMLMRLAELKDADLEATAARWIATAEFPDSQYSVEDVLGLLTQIRELARQANRGERRLYACAAK